MIRSIFKGTGTEASSHLLAARGLSSGYHGHPVVSDLDFHVERGEVVGLLGANGVGKSTTLRALAGELVPLTGDVVLHGKVTRAPAYRRARAGLSFVPEERATFSQLTVIDNLRVARCATSDVVALFPELGPLLKRKAALLSGGEQQMLSLGRALARKPAVLLADELSTGLAPMVVDRLLNAVRRAADEQGVGVLLVEQHVELAVGVMDRGYVMSGGRIVLEGSPADVASSLEDAYFGGAAV